MIPYFSLHTSNFTPLSALCAALLWSTVATAFVSGSSCGNPYMFDMNPYDSARYDPARSSQPLVQYPG